MLTVTELAERLGVSKQAVSLRVKRLIPMGLTIERTGRSLKVDVAEYEHLTRETGDPMKAQAPAQPRPAPSIDSLEEQRRIGVIIQNRRNSLALGEEIGELVRVDRVAESVARLGAELAAVIDRLPNAADDIAAAMAEDGTVGARRALKAVAHDLRRDAATLFARMADEAPDTDEMEDTAPMTQAAE